MSGWICSFRQMWDHALFKGDGLRVGVWHWLLHNAAWKETKFRVKGDVVTLSRGQVCLSHRQVEEATGMGRKALSTFLKALENEGAILVKTHHDARQGRTIVTICNYGKYQVGTEATAPETAPEPRQSRATKEQGKQLNNTPKPPEGAGEFDEFWSEYPHRGGQKKNRKGAVAKYRAAIKAGVEHEQIMMGVRAMRRFPDVARGFARDPAVWLNQEGWTDEAPSQAHLSTVHSRSKWQRGEIRVLTNGRVQEYDGYQWEFRNDLTPDDVAVAHA
ncbi:hypothetical protein [Paracoccus sulfuroxidans]|uniref:Uncharacterized protein n=1 Tax=Paracoccus sulfuroxidans TaxID=384678 RepID=A0A562NKM2_9RHOB|nr:hypothetical protein [Paracoccus sulfuroxidans]TWI32759.1 hypothetical protein IQ24_02634 [Paracoccus sulfuroxidans]